MSAKTIAALPLLASLAAKSASTYRGTDGVRGDRVCYTMRRCDVERIAAIQALADAGLTLWVHTGNVIRACVNGVWSERKAPKCRQNVLVEVAFA